MEVDAQKVIRKLLSRIAELELANATLQVAVEQLQEPE